MTFYRTYARILNTIKQGKRIDEESTSGEVLQRNSCAKDFGNSFGFRRNLGIAEREWMEAEGRWLLSGAPTARQICLAQAAMGPPFTADRCHNGT